MHKAKLINCAGILVSQESINLGGNVGAIIQGRWAGKSVGINKGNLSLDLASLDSETCSEIEFFCGYS